MVATRPGSKRTPTRSAGTTMASCSSAAVIGVTAKVLALTTGPRAGCCSGRSYRSARSVATTRRMVLGLGGVGQEVGEAVPDGDVGHQRPQLLELVDDQHQLLSRRDEVPGHRHQAARGAQAGRDGGLVLDGGHPAQRGLELDERVGAGHHRHHEGPAASELGHHSGVHERALARPRRTDHRHERLVGHPLDQVGHQVVPTAELAGVGLLERAETLVRVDAGHAEAGQGLRHRPAHGRGTRPARSCGPGRDPPRPSATRPRTRRRTRSGRRDAGAVAFAKTGPSASAPSTPASSGGTGSTSFTRPTSVTVDPANGARPLSASQTTTASAYWSDAADAVRVPDLLGAGVQRRARRPQVQVVVVAVAASAIPKSAR